MTHGIAVPVHPGAHEVDDNYFEDRLPLTFQESSAFVPVFKLGPQGDIEFLTESPEIHRPVKWDELLIADGAQDALQAKYNSVMFDSKWIPEIARQTDIILKNRITYEGIQKETGVPWWVIGILHMRESSFSFNGWLANGDSLSGPTVRVPAGLRGTGNPPWSWADAAVVSLKHHNGSRAVDLQSIGEALDYIERYNGLGYRNGAGRNTVPAASSPYIWSGTTGYQRGKYVADGQFSATAVDAQLGAAAIMMELRNRGIGLLNRKDTPNEQAPTWWEFFRLLDLNVCVGYAGSRPVIKLQTLNVSEMTELLTEHEVTAKTFRVAPAGKEIPDIDPAPQPAPQPEPKPVPAPGKNPLPVPYFYQYANRHEPAATCGLTSAAMLLKHQGKDVYPDGLYERFGKPQGQSPERLAALYRSFGLKSKHTYNGTYQDMRNAIDGGSAVVLHGYFTAGGHIICVIGYKDGFFVCNDPAGVWDGNRGSGYRGRPENGKAVLYAINDLVAACGRDRELWLSYVTS